ncbi:MAG: hypothetical protein M1816_005064 [Peltula sp. TS41687]|nr:MAG: hypothetical protein M1816_005064 [Peltula sp. TS41687]
MQNNPSDRSGDADLPQAQLRNVKTSKARKSRKSKAQINQKGEPSRPGSFLKCWDNEIKTAAYLQYKDLSDFRKFRLSFYVLEFFPTWFKYCAGKKSDAALALVRDLSDEDSHFPADLKTAEAKYPLVSVSTRLSLTSAQKKANKSSSEYIYATILYRLAEMIENPPFMTVDERQSRQEAALHEFESTILANARVPQFDISTGLGLPTLGPLTEFGEDRLEKYNRSVLAPSRWKERFGPNLAEPFRSVEISADALPSWMVKPLTSAQSLKFLQPLRDLQAQRLAKKTFPLIWARDKKTKYSDDLDRHIEEHIEYNEFSLPPTETIAEKDPRVYPSGEMWRDTVRRQLQFRELRLEFIKIRVVLGEKDILMYGHGNPMPWLQIREILNKEEDVVVTYTLRALYEEEDFELEYQGPPLGLAKDLALSDDVEIVQPGSSDIEIGTGQESETSPSLDNEEKAQVRAFLAGIGEPHTMQSLLEEPTPDKEYTGMDRVKMLLDHNGFDVSIPMEKLSWQHYVLDTICGVQPKPVKDRFLKLTQEQRTELERLKAEGELIALSVDTEQLDGTGSYYAIQAAFTGSSRQAGPAVDPSKIALGMNTSGKHGARRELDLSRCMVLPNCKREFLDSQITGAAFMLLRTFGRVPVSPKRTQDAPLTEALKELVGPQTFGGVIADGTGLGKTATSLLFASYYATNCPHEDKDGTPSHRPMLFVVPSGIILNQWQEEIFNNFQDLELIISHGDRPPSPKFSNKWVSATAMREAPDRLVNWPENLLYALYIEESNRATPSIKSN